MRILDIENPRHLQLREPILIGTATTLPVTPTPSAFQYHICNQIRRTVVCLSLNVDPLAFELFTVDRCIGLQRLAFRAKKVTKDD